MVSVDKLFLFGIFLISAYLYLPLNRRRSRFYWKSPIDRKIPLIPIFVIPYYFYLVYAPLALLIVWLFGGELLTRFLIAFIIANFSASFFWFFFPNGIRRPKIKRKGLMLTLVKDLYLADRYDTNAFPSNHVYGATICSFFMSLSFPPLTPIFAVIGFSIIISTVLVKQHHIADLAAGLVWGIASIFLAGLV